MINIKNILKENKLVASVLNGMKLCGRKYPDDSLALHTDLYQINMAETYWENDLHNRKAVFDIYFRKLPFNNGYAVFAGLQRVIEYLKDYRFSKSDIAYLRDKLGYQEDFLEYLKTVKFEGSIKSVVEGEIVFPNQPILRVEAPLAQAQLIETALLNIVNYHQLIATKAARIRVAADDNEVFEDDTKNKSSLMEFGTRRAQEMDAAIHGTRAAYIGGFNATSNVRAGKLFEIPVAGTHAHSMIQVFGDEYTAFKKYAGRHKNCVFLVDTYDTLKSGVPNAIKVAKELGEKINFVGIRLDSGDLAHLSKEARKMLDEAGFPKARIFASNDLDEYEIKKLKEQGAKIDSWGIGTKLITAYDQPALGCVYKLAAIEDENGNMMDTIKLSETAEKTSTPGMKTLYKIVDLINNRFEGDYIALEGENPTVENNTYSKQLDSSYEIKNVHKDIFVNGKLVYEQPSIHEMREYCMQNLKLLRDSNRTMDNPEKFPVVLSKKCSENKMRMVEEIRNKIAG